MEKLDKQSGFTLLEIVVSLSILSILGVVLSQSFITALRTNIKGDISQEVKQSGGFAQEIMSRMILNAPQITSTCTIEGATNESIVLTNPDGGITTFECKEDSGVFRIASTSATGSVYLTGSGITLAGETCTGVTFDCKLVGDGKKQITIQYELKQKNVQAGVFEKSSTQFQTIVTTRN